MRLRVVLDTNVVLASRLSSHARSPNVEIMQRWDAGDFSWLITHDILAEYAEKLLEHGFSEEVVTSVLEKLDLTGEMVNIVFFHLRYYPRDADDTAFLLAALNGNASHLVTYDDDLDDAGVHYTEFKTCRPLEFLSDLRAAMLV